MLTDSNRITVKPKCLNNKSNYYKAMYKVNKSPNKQVNSYITIK